MGDRLFNQLHLKKNVSGFLVVAEVLLINKSSVNVAPLGTASASSEDFGGLAENAIDGSTNNSNVADTIHHSATGPAETWTLTMDREYLQSELSEVTILARNIGNNHDDITVELLSNDGAGPLVLGITDSSITQTFSIPFIAAGPQPKLISGAVAYINANIPESYTSGAAFMSDLSGGSNVFNFNSGVTPPILNGGGVDLTAGGNALQSSQQLQVQTISLWFSRVGQNFTILSLRPEEVDAKVNGQSMQGAFFASQTIYMNGVLSTVNDFVNLQENVLVNVVFVGDYLSALCNPILFGNLLLGSHYHATFMSALFYDRALTAQEIMYNYTTLLSFPTAELEFPAFTSNPRATNILINIEEVVGATGYRLTTQKTGSNIENIFMTNFTDLIQNIENLIPSTEYTVRLYSTTNSIFELIGEENITTLENSSSNYNKNDYLNTSGRFDFTSFDKSSLGLISEFMNDIFTTGENIDINLSGKTKISKFVNRGGTVDITGSEALVAPFTTTGGSGQSVSLTLSNSSTVGVNYDETTEEITIDSEVYNTGDSFILDGKKVTILNI